MDTPRKNAHIIKAWADGIEIEFLFCGRWVDFGQSHTDITVGSELFQWRIKSKKIIGWLNIFNTQGHYLFPTKEAADKHWLQMCTQSVKVDRLACIKIEYTVGEGLN